MHVIKLLNPEITQRCGLHVHVDARDYSADDLAKLIRLFLLVEPLVYQMVEHHRSGVKYCISSRTYRPYGKPNLDINTLKAFLYGGEFEYSIIKQKQKKNTSSQDIRYRGLNLHSFFYRGTIEFRHHHGSVDPAEIYSWAMFCGFLLDAAKAVEWEPLLEIPDSIYAPPEFASQIMTIVPKTTPNWQIIQDIVNKCFKRNAVETDETGIEAQEPRAVRINTDRGAPLRPLFMDNTDNMYGTDDPEPDEYDPEPNEDDDL
jgi:Putative amidoligase enzyme